MGYVDDDDHYRLEFQDGRRAGLEVLMTGLTVQEHLNGLDVADGFELAALAGKRIDEWADRSEEIAGKLRRQHGRHYSKYVTLAAHLVSWNVETKDGQPVPTTLDGVLSQRLTLIDDILTAWRTAVSGVETPLEPTSPAGGQSPTPGAAELSIPMEPLSSSHSPSPARNGSSAAPSVSDAPQRSG